MKMRAGYFFGAILLLFTACRENHEVKKKVSSAKKVIVAKLSPDPVAPVVPDSVWITAVGDIMLGSSYPDQRTLPPDSGKSSFKEALPYLQGSDITFGNLEGTLLNSGAPAHYKLHLLSKAYLFRMPEEYAGILKTAGFNVLSLANNHIGDFGDKGRLNTMKVLDSAGIYYGGQLTHPSAVFKIKGITYGFCAFAPNAQTLPLLDYKFIRKTVKELKQQCDIVIVSFHGGNEGTLYEHVPFRMESYFREKRGDVRKFAHTAIDAGADLVLGNGPHVCRAMEIYKKRLIAYSLGNFCTYTYVNVTGACGYAPLLKVCLNKNGEFLNGKITNFRQSHPKGLQLDTLNNAARRIKLLTEKDFGKTGVLIGDDGTISKPGEK